MTSRPRVVWYGRLAGLGMLLLAVEGLLGFGPETRAALIALVGFCVYRGLASARQWNVSDEQAIGPKDVREGPVVDP